MTTWAKVAIDVKPDYSDCFGCGQRNPIGLKLRFQWDGKTARAEFTPSELYQGWPGTVHGGIMMCLLDEVMSYAVVFDGNRCVTARIQVRLRRLTPIKQSLLLSGWVTRKTRKLVETRASVSLEDGTIVAEGTGTHFIVDFEDGTNGLVSGAGEEQ